jgi:hypothetical protein
VRTLLSRWGDKEFLWALLALIAAIVLFINS